MDTTKEVIAILDHVLGLNGRASSFTRDTRLLGAIPELDSMGVASILTSLEDRYGFAVNDDEIDGSSFATVGSLADFVSACFGFGKIFAMQNNTRTELLTSSHFDERSVLWHYHRRKNTEQFALISERLSMIPG